MFLINYSAKPIADPRYDIRSSNAASSASAPSTTTTRLSGATDCAPVGSGTIGGRRKTLYGGLACKVLASDSWFFDIQRGRNQQEFRAANVALFECVAPHIQRAVETGRQFQVNQALPSAFSHLPFGIVAVNGGQRIVTANEAAEAILASPGGALPNKGGCVVAVDARAAARLDRLILEACSFHEGLAPGLDDERAASLAISVGPLLRGRRRTAPSSPAPSSFAN